MIGRLRIDIVDGFIMWPSSLPSSQPTVFPEYPATVERDTLGVLRYEVERMGNYWAVKVGVQVIPAIHPITRVTRKVRALHFFFNCSAQVLSYSNMFAYGLFGRGDGVYTKFPPRAGLEAAQISITPNDVVTMYNILVESGDVFWLIYEEEPVDFAVRFDEGESISALKYQPQLVNDELQDNGLHASDEVTRYYKPTHQNNITWTESPTAQPSAAAGGCRATSQARWRRSTRRTRRTTSRWACR